MITSLRIQNFKGHIDTTVPLGRFTVLVGPNGSGKTSVLQALHSLCELAWKGPGQVFEGELGYADLMRRASQGPLSIAAQGILQNVAWKASIDLEVPQGTVEWRPTITWRYGKQALERTVGAETSRSRASTKFAEALGGAVLYSFDARQIAAAAYSDEENPWVESDGTNTAVVLAALKLDQDEKFERIEAELRQIVPSVERVRVRREKVRMKDRGPGERDLDVMGHKIYLDFKGASNVPAHGASQGTLITLALLTALCGPTHPNLLLLDDIDQALHPQAQVELVRQLKRLLEEFKDVQIVATTHSPYVLDEMDPADVQVFALRDDGSVAVKRLSEHPEAARMKGALSAGQIWSLDPEKSWVAEEKP